MVINLCGCDVKKEIIYNAKFQFIEQFKSSHRMAHHRKTDTFGYPFFLFYGDRSESTHSENLRFSELGSKRSLVLSCGELVRRG